MGKVNVLYNRDCLDIAQLYADKMSGCKKVAVGSLIAKDGKVLSLGANKSIPDLCKCNGCLRVSKYGEDSKNHRNPEDCRAIHSEVDAISCAASIGTAVEGATIYVTRYPCESCAKAIISAGIKRVFYGGTAHISTQTANMFESYGVECTYVPFWKEDHSDR